MYTAESYWFNVLTDTQRLHYERCVSAVIAYYDGSIAEILKCADKARARRYTDSPLVAAILWRLLDELS